MLLLGELRLARKGRRSGDNKAVSQPDKWTQLSRQGEQVCAVKVRKWLPFSFDLSPKAPSSSELLPR